jgi:hypothetical protein
VLAWHMPQVKFGLGQKQYSKFGICFFDYVIRCFFVRWYTKWFDPLTLNGTTLCAHAMKNRTKWEEAITKWQQPILDDLYVN